MNKTAGRQHEKPAKGRDIMDVKARYAAWLNSPFTDEETKAELSAIAGDEKEIYDRFFQDLEFGTAGMRGLIATRYGAPRWVLPAI